MIKRFLSVILALLLCFSMFACGKKAPADDVFDSVINVFEKGHNNSLSKYFDGSLDTVRVSAGFKDLGPIASYAALLGGDIDIPNISDVKADLYFDFADMRLAQSAEAKVNGEKISASAYEDFDSIVIDSALVGGAYGFATDEVLGDDFSDYEDEIAEGITAIVNLVNSREKLFDNYMSVLKTAVRENVTIVANKSGKNTVYIFELTPDNGDAIFEKIAKALKQDNTLEEVCEAFDGDIDDIAEGFEEIFDYAEGKLECEFTVGGNSVLTEAVITVIDEYGDEVGDIVYDYDASSGDFSFEILPEEDDFYQVVKVSGTMDKNGYGEYVMESVSGSKEYGYESNSKTSMAVTKDTIEVGFKTSYESSYGSDEQEVSAKFGYEVKGNMLKLSIGNVGYLGTEIDLGDLGAYIEIEKGVKVPKAPKYEKCDPDDIYDKILDPLGEKLYDLVG